MGEEGVVERLIKESKGHTIVVLDTKTMTDVEQTGPITPVYEESRSGIQTKEAPLLNKETLFSKEAILLWDEVIDKEEAMMQLLDACLNNNKNPERFRMGCTYGA